MEGLLSTGPTPSSLLEREGAFVSETVFNFHFPDIWHKSVMVFIVCGVDKVETSTSGGSLLETAGGEKIGRKERANAEQLCRPFHLSPGK